MTSRSSTPRQRPLPEAGFTLLEMIVAIAVIGLALAVVASFMPRRHAALDVAVASDSIAQTLRAARSRALAQQRPVVVTVARNGQGYAVDGISQPLPAGIGLRSSGSGIVRFAPDGSASPAAILISADGRSLLLRVDWLTGLVHAADTPR